MYNDVFDKITTEEYTMLLSLTSLAHCSTDLFLFVSHCIAASASDASPNGLIRLWIGLFAMCVVIVTVG
jgi:hypothetical protein